jgi:hypothetical protein
VSSSLDILRNMPRKQTAEKLAALVETARSAKSRARERALGLVREVEENRHDRRRLPRAGRALEELQRGKRYKALGFATYAAFLVSVGISRSTAHVWRGMAPARREEDEAEAEDAAAGVVARLASGGVKAEVCVVLGGVVRMEVSAKDARRIRVR